MSQFLPEMTMGRAVDARGMTRLALRAHRYYDLSQEAEARGATTRARMLRLISTAYNSAGLAWFHRRYGDGPDAFERSCGLFQQADECLDQARALVEPEGGLTVSSPPEVENGTGKR